MSEYPRHEPDHDSESSERPKNDQAPDHYASDWQSKILADLERAEAELEQQRQELDEEVRKLEEGDRMDFSFTPDFDEGRDESSDAAPTNQSSRQEIDQSPDDDKSDWQSKILADLERAEAELEQQRQEVDEEARKFRDT